MLPRLVPEILSKCAFCDGVGAGVGIGDSRNLMYASANPKKSLDFYGCRLKIVDTLP